MRDIVIAAGTKPMMVEAATRVRGIAAIMPMNPRATAALLTTSSSPVLSAMAPETRRAAKIQAAGTCR